MYTNKSYLNAGRKPMAFERLSTFSQMVAVSKVGDDLVKSMRLQNYIWSRFCSLFGVNEDFDGKTLKTRVPYTYLLSLRGVALAKEIVENFGEKLYKSSFSYTAKNGVKLVAAPTKGLLGNSTSSDFVLAPIYEFIKDHADIGWIELLDVCRIYYKHDEERRFSEKFNSIPTLIKSKGLLFYSDGTPVNR